MRKRLITYFQGGAAARKERTIAAHAQRLVWEVVGHPLAAQLRELELIRRHQPRFNVQGRERLRPLSHLYFSDETAPRLRIGRRVPRSARHSWGPLKVNWQIREAVEIVNRLFKLCDCPTSTPMHFAEQGQLFPLELRALCLRGEIGSCLGPCAGLCTRGEYAAQIRAAQAFLDGRDDQLLATLEARLHEAVHLLQFERAARVYDGLERLRFLHDRLALLREPPLPPEFVYPAQLGRRNAWLFVVGGEVVAAAPAPLDATTADRCRTVLRRIFDDGQRRNRTEPDRPAAAIVSSWFRTHPAELATILTPDAALRAMQAG